MVEPLTLALGAGALFGLYKIIKGPAGGTSASASSPLAPTPPINIALARRLAPAFAQDFDMYMGLYDQALLRTLKNAAGLRTKDGTANAVYAGSTAGMLKAYGVTRPPKPLRGRVPAELIPYVLPKGSAGVSGVRAHVGEPVSIVLGVASFVMGAVAFFTKTLPGAVSDASWKNKVENLEISYRAFREMLSLLDELGKVFPKCRVRGSDRIFRYNGEVEDAEWNGMDDLDKTWHTPMSFVRFPWIHMNQAAAIASALEPTPMGTGLHPQPVPVRMAMSNAFEDTVWRAEDGLPNVRDFPETHATDPAYLRAFLEPDFMAAPELLEWHGWTTDPEGKRGQEETNRLLSKEYITNLVGRGKERVNEIIRQIRIDGMQDPWAQVPVDPSEVSAELRAARGYTIPMTVPAREGERPRYIYGNAKGPSFASNLYPEEGSPAAETNARIARTVLDRGGRWISLQSDLQPVGSVQRPPLPNDPLVQAGAVLVDAFARQGIQVTMTAPPGALIEDAIFAAAAASGTIPTSVPPPSSVGPQQANTSAWDLLAPYRAPQRMTRDTTPTAAPTQAVTYTALEAEPDNEAKRIGVSRNSAEAYLAVAMARGLMYPNEPPRITPSVGGRPSTLVAMLQAYKAQADQGAPGAKRIMELTNLALRGPANDNEAVPDPPLPKTPEEMRDAIRRMNPAGNYNHEIVRTYQRAMGFAVQDQTGVLDPKTVAFARGG